MVRLTDTIKHILFINVIVFLVVHFMLPRFLDTGTIRQYSVLFSPDTGYFEPVQIVTNMWNHADFRHLLFNMLGLIFLGPVVEQTLGEKRFFILYLTAGIAGGLPTLLMPQAAVLGASGAVLGVVTAFAAMYPNMQLRLLFPPIPVKAKYLVAAYIAYDLFFAVSGANTGIAHYAHLVGALMGFALVIYWGLFNLRSR